MTSTRILAAAVGLVFLLPAVIYGGTVAVEVIAVLAAVVCTVEYASMAFPEDRWGGGVAVFASYLALHAATVWGPPGAVGVVAAFVGVGSMVLVTFRPGEQVELAAGRAARIVLGAGWISLLLFLVALRRLDHGLAWLFLVLAVSWLGDTGAYFAGRFLGRHPLYPRISPKKTWEGVLGGITLATVGTFCVRAIGLPELSVVDCLILGPGLCVVGVVGDLAESMIKRAFDVKDSGWILPGHGGLLDRIDSVLFVGPFLFTWVVLLEGSR